MIIALSISLSMLQFGTSLLTLLKLASFPSDKRRMTFYLLLTYQVLFENSLVEPPKYLSLFLLFLAPHEEHLDSMSFEPLDLKMPLRGVKFCDRGDCF